MKAYKESKNKKITIKMAKVQWNADGSVARWKIVKPGKTEYRFARFEVKTMPLNEAKKLGNEFVINERS